MKNRDVLELLREANPVPTPRNYSDGELNHRIAKITAGVEAAAEPLSLLAPASVARRRQPSGWTRPGIAAAVVVLLTAVTFAVHVVHRGSAANPVAGPTVECAVSTAGGPDATKVRLRSAAGVLATRVASMGGHISAVTTRPSVGTISFAPRGISVKLAAPACGATTTSIRPLLTRPVSIVRSGARTRTPLRGLHFAVSRAKLTSVLAHVDCGHVAAARRDQVTVACGSRDGAPNGPKTSAYLLGPALAAGPDIVSAKPIPPSASTGAIEWAVELSLTRGSSASMTVFTRAHAAADARLGIQNSLKPAFESVLGCSVSSVPCADFLGTEVNGTVISAPLTVATLSGTLHITGGFTQASAASFAADFTAAGIGLRPVHIR